MAQVGFLGQPDPCNEIDSKYDLGIIFENELLSGDLLFWILYKERFNEVVNSFFDLFLGQFKYFLHLRLQLEVDVL